MQNITVKWDSLEDRRIVWETTQGWTWDEFNRALETTRQMGLDMNQTVNVMVLLDRHITLPQSGLEFTHFCQAMHVAMNQGGVVVLVGDNLIARNLTKVFTKVYPRIARHLWCCESIEKARQTLEASNQLI